MFPISTLYNILILANLSQKSFAELPIFGQFSAKIFWLKIGRNENIIQSGYGEQIFFWLMELHTFRYPNLHSAFPGEIFSIRLQPHQEVSFMNQYLFMKYYNRCAKRGKPLHISLLSLLNDLHILPTLFVESGIFPLFATSQLIMQLQSFQMSSFR